MTMLSNPRMQPTSASGLFSEGRGTPVAAQWNVG
jgi:hypothetical protein